jgi:hypothetical protein
MVALLAIHAACRPDNYRYLFRQLFGISFPASFAGAGLVRPI